MKKRIALFCSRARLGLVAALLGAVAASAATGWIKGKPSAENRPKPTLNINQEPLAREGGMTVSFAPVIQKAAPSVVKVFTSSEAKFSARPETDMLERFFGERFEGYGFQPAPESLPKRGMGSGVIVSPEGYILTNNHVIQGADEVKVVLSPGDEEYIAEVVGVDPKSDVAVLRIEAENLMPMELGDSDQMLVGDVVLAIGNPFGVGQTVTMGMVSAKGRAQMGLDYEDFIQTDAAINPGNSGGALVDGQGRLIGINTAILSQSGGNLGIGFAIPINLARSVMESLIDHGHVVRGYLGVKIQDVNPAMARHFELDANAGAVIADVVSDSPAEAAGLQAGDVVVEFDGKPVKDSRNLKLMIGQSVPNKGYPIEVIRDGDNKMLEVSLDVLNEDGPQWARSSSNQGTHAWPADMKLSEITPEFRRRYQIPDEVDGLIVTAVQQGESAWRAGLRPGTIIREINRIPVSDLDDLKAFQFAEDEILLRIWADGSNLYRVIQNKPVG